ncbi:MAG: response regulator transcription factor [Oscillibacter sp.]|nr:response regulator transcription factor [Oscillibacter sp.]
MIFCVEDDAAIRNMMVYTLNSSGFPAQGLEDGSALFSALEKELPQLILLDIMLPGMDGIEILKRLRLKADTANLPVIMATAKGTEYDRVLGLDLGADDYLSKPFGMMEMVSRVRAVLRRTAPKSKQGNSVTMGELTLDRTSHTVTLQGKALQLTLKEYALLDRFLSHPGRVFTRDQLLSDVWGVDYAGETRTVDVHIGTLRTKLGSLGQRITTVRGVGYRMEGEK